MTFPKQKTMEVTCVPMVGLSAEQRIRVNAYLADARKAQQLGGRRAGERSLEGWYVYREPTTIHPPTTLRLHKRLPNGKLILVISITEKGVMK